MLKSEVESRLVSFRCVEIDSGRVRGSGTAFWANIPNEPKLVTAKHIAWPSDAKPPVQVVNGEQLRVEWKMVDGTCGGGIAEFRTHPTNLVVDFATIHFSCAYEAPPVNAFNIDRCCQTKGTYVVATGFPGPYCTCGSPQFATEIGTVEVTVPSSGQILANGSACGGYSGGPAFQYTGEETVGELVVGLMSGGPHVEVLLTYGLANGFVLAWAGAFP